MAFFLVFAKVHFFSIIYGLRFFWLSQIHNQNYCIFAPHHPPSMKIEETRKILIDAARKLFRQVGLKNTTMNDIARTSQKGRRTLYTYFSSKDEVLDAVVEEELQYIIASLERVMRKNINPLDKFKLYVVTRMNTVRTAVQRNGSLQAEFFRDIIRVELVRRRLEKIEINNLAIILQAGIDKGIFDIDDVKQSAIFIHFLIRGLDVPYIRGMFDSADMPQEAMIKQKIHKMIKGMLKENKP